MTDILVRDVPEAVIAALDAAAARAGVSRVEYVRRTLVAEVDRAERGAQAPLTRDDWQQFSALTGDLANDEVMRGAWS
jgi:hypothetical protein